ncbi:hypothetical protein [Sulfitobacter sp. SK012]|nr:hypothetical protein [Sulfitobacter sp. SK012]
MAAIVRIERKSGARYRAKIIKKKGGKVVFTKSATFEREATAKAWAKRGE